MKRCHDKIFLMLSITCCLKQFIQASITAVSIQGSENFNDIEAKFGASIPPHTGIMGFLVAQNGSGCTPLKTAPITNWTTFALIKRGGCTFALKVYHAQLANYKAVVIYNDKEPPIQQKMPCHGGICNLIKIPSVFVVATDGAILSDAYTYIPGVSKAQQPYIKIFSNDSSFSIMYYIIPFGTVVGTVLVFFIIFMVARFARNRRRTRRNRLSKQRLKQLPVKQFSKGDEYDICAICLDEYEEGDSLRILPCHHAYHCQCVDPWLTSSKRVCPLCKRRVLSDDESSASDSDYDDTTSEDAPLLHHSNAASPNSSRFATGFSSQNPFTRSYRGSAANVLSSQESVMVIEVPFPSNQNRYQSEVPHGSQTTPESFVTPKSTPVQAPAITGADNSRERSHSVEVSRHIDEDDTLFETDETQALIRQGGTSNSARDATANESTVT